VTGPAFTAAEKQACAEREVRLRQRVYGRRVAEGKMTPALADRETRLMQAIADDYAAAAAKERLL
jgi:hypothetical protein